MQNTYERVVELMGASKDGPLFAQFVMDLGEQPIIFKQDDISTEYMFNNAGLALSFMEVSRHSSISGFAHAFFHNPASGHAELQRYGGDLPNNIKFEDNRHDVERKLKTKPISSKLSARGPDSPPDVWEDYAVGPLKLSFIFRGVQGTISLLSIHYSPSSISA